MRRVWLRRSWLAVFMLMSVVPAMAQVRSQSIARVGLVTRAFQPAVARNWRGAEKKELHCLIWYPAIDTAAEVKQYLGPQEAPLFEAGSASPNAEWAPALTKLPMIVISHGTGGSALQMAWLGTALARAGFIAVAVDHPGNHGGSGEPYTAEGFVLWWERATDLSEVIDGMLADPDLGPHVDSSRIGAAGFSLGGYTVLELAGARTDISVFYDKCRQHAEGCVTPEMRNLGTQEEMLAKVRKSSGESIARSGDSFRDARVKAVYLLGPGLVDTLTTDSLRAIRLPVEMVVGDADTLAPAAQNADDLRANIHGARETVLPGVTHYDFLDSCAAAGKERYPAYCSESPGVDRERVHQQVGDLAAGFFARAMRAGKGR